MKCRDVPIRRDLSQLQAVSRPSGLSVNKQPSQFGGKWNIYRSMVSVCSQGRAVPDPSLEY
jgi:hypothetical protein